MILAIAALKGGTGKTTTAAALAQAAALQGKNVLAIDLDPQCNLTLGLGAALDAAATSVALLHGSPAAGAVQATAQGIWCIAGNPDLAAETTSGGSGRRLAQALQPIRGGYDLTVIDTPPQLGELTINALLAADAAILPMRANVYSLQGLDQTVKFIRQLQGINTALKVLGVVVTCYRGQANIEKFSLQEIQGSCRRLKIPFLSVIRQGTAAVEAAQNLQRSLYEYAPRSKPAQDYLELYQLITTKGGGRHGNKNQKSV